MEPDGAVDYFGLFFDVNRSGYAHVAEKIVSYLDFHSLIQLKRTSRIIHEFISSSNLEQVKLKKKLHGDWELGSFKELTINAPGLVGCTRISEESDKIVAGVDEQVQVSNVRTGERILSLRGHESVVTCVELLNIDHRQYIISGSKNGVLVVWSLDDGECVDRKQLFGRIEVIKAKDNLVVTAHFGIAYDVGCISIRRVESPNQMPVIHSVYQELLPIFCLDFNFGQSLACIEWSGTYNNVHAGNIIVFRWMQPEIAANLSDIVDYYSFTCCRFIGSFLVTGGHDKLIRVWDLSCDVRVTKIIDLHSNVIVRLELNAERAVTRDLDGNIFIWDTERLTDERGMRDEDPEYYLVRKVTSNSRTVTCIAMDWRRLVMGSIGSFCVFDYWNTYKEIL